MQIGLGLSVPILSVLRKLASALFSPSSLFSNSEVGVWYDPSDLSTMYQDSAGTTPVTGLEQPVGLILDKSKGLTLGSELVTDGTFTSLDAWPAEGAPTIREIDGNGDLHISGTHNTGVNQTISGLVAGWYEVVTEAKTVTGAIKFQMNFSTTIAPAVWTSSFSTSTYKVFLSGTQTSLKITCSGTAEFYVRSISIRRLAGNHAYQSTSTARPVLRARYNLLTYSEQFDNAAWTKTNATITANATTAPDGTTTADKLVEASDSAVLHSTNSGNFALLGGQFTFSIYAKAGERNWLLLNITPASGVYSSSDARAWFDLSNGTVGTVGGTGATASITAAANGWYRCVLVGNYAVLSNRRVLAATATADGSSSNDGDGTSGIYIWGAQLVANSVFPQNTYQRIEAAPSGNGTVTYATGADFPPYLFFDGSDDSLSTASIDFSATDEISVFAGVTKNSDAADADILQLGVDNTAGGFTVKGPQTATNASYSLSAIDSATLGGGQRFRSYAAPISSVLAFVIDYSQTAINSVIAFKRINGSVPSIIETVGNSTLGGSSVAANAALSIGKRGAVAARFFNGSLYSLIVRGKTSTATEIDDTEAYVAQKTGVTL